MTDEKFLAAYEAARKSRNNISFDLPGRRLAVHQYRQALDALDANMDSAQAKVFGWAESSGWPPAAELRERLGWQRDAGLAAVPQLKGVK